MVFAISSDPLLNAAIWVGIAAFAVSLLLLVAIVILRTLLLLRQVRERRLIAHYRPLLLQALEASVPGFDLRGRPDRRVALRLWVDLHESLRGPAKERLNVLGRACGFDRHARELLDGANVRKQMLGIAVAGLLRDREAWGTLLRLSQAASGPLSLAAARALLLIDAETALPGVLAEIARRSDWPDSRVAATLLEVGADRFTAPLTAAIRATRDVQGMTRLLRLLELGHLGEAAAMARDILGTTEDPAVMAAALRLLHGPGDLPLVRRLCRHPEWIVRVQAARALGRIGSTEDRPLLMELLGDRTWWVRYRSAEALAGMPSVTAADLEALRAAASDRFARDILAHVIAERGAA